MAHKVFFFVDWLGDLKIIKPAYNDPTRTIMDDTEFEASVVAAALAKRGRPYGYTGPMPIPYTICGECLWDDLPTDRYFRDAWEWSD